MKSYMIDMSMEVFTEDGETVKAVHLHNLKNEPIPLLLWCDILERIGQMTPGEKVMIVAGEQKPLSQQESMDIAVAKCFEQGEQKPDTNFSDLRTWKYIVDAVWTEKEGIGQYLDSPFTEEVAKKLQKRFGNIGQKPAVDTKVIIPKFRVGDIVKSKSQPMLRPRKIISIGKDCYRCEDRGCIGFAWEDDCEIVEQKPVGFNIGDEITVNGQVCMVVAVDKPAWSEEDEEIVEALNDYVKNLDILFSEIKIGDKDILSKEFCEKVQSWLKSLKDRVMLQPQKELSDGDEEVINLACSILYSNFNENENFDKNQMCIGEIIDKLKSLRPQNRWKPSEEQMNTLEYYMHTLVCNEHKEILFGLYTDLKKLRG